MMKICMESSMNRVGNIVILSLLIVGVLYISISTTDISKNFLQLKYYQCSSSSSNETTGNMVTYSQLDELENVLRRASKGNNKTLIITVVNKAYVEGEKSMLDLFLDSFWVGEDTQLLVNHLLVVAMDQIAYDRCKFLRLHCYRLVTDGVDFGGEKFYMSHDFVNMMWRRTLFLANVLQRGYNFIFTDTDILWLGNPFTKLSKDESEDIQISVDWFNGNPRATSNPINTGFYFVRSNNKTASLFETWYAVRNESDYRGMKEQDVIEKMMRNGVLEEMGIKAMFLDSDVFSGFCHHSKDFRSVVTVHANCCRSINAKVADLMVVFRDWRRYRSSISTADSKNRSDSNAEKRTLGWSKHVACLNSWKNLNGSSS